MSAAHRGYVYQDIFTAYLLIKGLIIGFDRIVIDKKVVGDDRFDDVETCIGGQRLRMQVKSSVQPNRCISFNDFNDVSSSLRFDRLVRTFIDEGETHADEYRLCATWGAPELDDELVKLLILSDVSGTFDGYATVQLRLDASTLWPRDKGLVFPNAHQKLIDAGGVSREDVLRFCQYFVIEVGLPFASLDLDAPGPLEKLVLGILENGVGIGRYPNDARRVEDVAALAVYIATTARTTGETLTKIDFVRRLGIRTDFGRVAQAFPIDRAIMQERTAARNKLMEAVSAGGIHLLLSGPGSGKSWLLTQLSEDLEASGIVVARHYCFLEPGDELVERRVMTDVFIGNLMGELRDALERHSAAHECTYAAGLEEFERMLEYAAQDGRRVVVIVDGMDHIARVVAGSTSLSDSETDIVEKLATLRLPEGVTLVVGSQPGSHLDAIRGAGEQTVIEHYLAPWGRQEIEEFSVALGVSGALCDLGLDEEEQHRAVFDTLAQRSEGNPLYARYLSRALVSGLRSTEIVSPVEWLESAPEIEGDISRYYQHLYDSSSKEAQAIADVLGVLDFSVTAVEVQEIVGPLLEDRVAGALATMSPVLSQASTQGGVRVFHESFRRFMMSEIERRGSSVAKILQPVATWLESKNFFADAKSYRFSLPVMRRSGRATEILQKIASDFVSVSVEHGHPRIAIERNLELAADVAARNVDWPALMRIGELWRALDACFSEGNNNWKEFWKTFLSIFGPQSTSERLLFDGRATLEREEGLSVCALVDAAGASAPWREYISLPVSDFSSEDSYSSNFDALGTLLSTEKSYLDAIRGRLHLGQYYRVLRISLAFLSNPGNQVTSGFIRKLAHLLIESCSASTVRQLVNRAKPEYRGAFALSPGTACALLLGLSDAAKAEFDFCGPMPSYAGQALAYATTLDEVLWCLDAGASLQEAFDAPVKKSELNAFLSATKEQPETSSLRAWVATVRLLGRSERGRTELNDMLPLVRGAGWYLCWVRFVINISVAEGLAAENSEFDVVAAFQELTVDTRPFVGTPRACDLYFSRGVIMESVGRGLLLLRSAQDWQLALESLFEARSKTATHFDREDGGPITAGAFFSILLSHIGNPQATDAITTILEKQLEDEEASGTYYSTHAEFRMRLARMHSAVGNRQRAVEHWRKAAQFLTAYTFRKDAALFDILDSVSALKEAPGKAALHGLVRLQPLLSAVLRHTDHRGTKNAPNAWFRALLDVDEIRAVMTLSRSFAADVGGPSWMELGALEDVLNKVVETADPLIVNALWETLLFEIEYEGEGEKMVRERLASLERLAQSAPVYLEDRFTCLSGQAQNDSRSYSASSVAPLQDFAERHGLQFLRSSSITQGGAREIQRGASVLAEETELALGTRPVFPITFSMVDIITVVRRIAKERVDETSMYGLLTLPLSYALSEMVERGEEVQALRILYFLVHEVTGWSYSSIPHPIRLLAQCLENAGHSRLAAVAYVLEFTSARGGRGWLNFGDRELASVIRRALELDKINALQALANETARKLRLGNFNGLTKHLVQQIALWGDVHTATNAWEAAFDVMAARLPLTGSTWYFEPLEVDDDSDWNLDEGLVALLLVRSTDPSIPRRTSALAGFVRLLERHGEILRRPVNWFLTSCTTVASVQAVLQLLYQSPWDVTSIISFNENLLRAYAKSKSWSLSKLAILLLGENGIYEDAPFFPALSLDEAPSRRGLMLAQYGDVGECLPILAEVWPDLPSIVARRMQHPDIDNEHFKELMQEHLRLMSGRGLKCRPSADVFLWVSELLVSVLDETLCGLRAHLWVTGQWNSELDYEILQIVLPDLLTRIALHASLGPRPAMPFPTEASRAVEPIFRMSEDAPKYSRWIRIAIREKHYFHSESQRWDAPDRCAELVAGVVRTEVDGTVPCSAGPFGCSDMQPWWEDFDEEEARENARLPQLVKLFAANDWLGECLALVPPLALRHKAKLQPPVFGAPLRWTDENGAPALVLRTWRLRGDELNVECYSTQGCELLLRPDLEEALYTTFGGPLKELSQVRLMKLANKPPST
ncbi:ATP-binding protein [Uliginosibacterium sp. TH139]|uniref:ATP-binding protein n=1 Tax=Uliginosibacterium sp. TH139 TaxID=2067453 RepID=UPI000CCB4C07|nr:ATP-binding protein [Uliginosibacterium sp. TH139]PLK49846.1 hypothetical protein C0V76_05355 [Uliginosibacterium sp. TH139]